MTDDYDPSGDHVIFVYCDNPAHTRAKIVRVETFARIKAFGDDWLVRGEREEGPGVETFTHPDGTVRRNYRCVRCGLCWPCTERTRGPVLDRVSAMPEYLQGPRRTRVSLRNLIAVASIPA